MMKQKGIRYCILGITEIAILAFLASGPALAQPGPAAPKPPTDQPAAQPGDQPAAQPGDQPAAQPDDQPAAQPGDQPAAQPGDQPAAQPAGQPGAQPAGQPGAQPAGQPGDQPAAQPAGQPGAQPAGQPGGQPAAQPADQSGAAPDTTDQAAADTIPADDLPVEAKGEVIVVTGSRIRTDPLDAPSPVLQITSEELERTGLTSVADILQKLPVSGGALNTKFNSSGNFGFPPDGGGIGAGAAQADLRYLGSKRVLVLVDGVRWINGSSASGVSAATDLNTIPVGIIERIEVLEDGASPIYGSDAIGGVINIITKKNWEGMRANAYVGGFHQLDGFTQQYDVSWAQKNERMSISFSVSVVDQSRVAAADRSIARYPIAGFDECTGNCSSATPQGRFVFIDPNTGEEVDVTINNGVDGVPVYDPADPNAGGDFHAFTVADRFNYSQYNLVMTPSRRVGVFSGVEYKVAPRITAFARALFNSRQSTNQAAPEPLFVGPDAGNGNRLDTIEIDVTNPYNPFGFTLDASTNYFIGRRPIEAGPRIFKQNVNTWYMAGGLRGDFKIGKSAFQWDTTAVYSINRADQIKNGGFNSAKLQRALGPVDECRADPDCVPFNLFGGQGADGEGTISRAMLDYVTFVQKDVSEQKLFDVSANLAGDLVKLPAGFLSMAAGVEHRWQSGFFQPDAVVVAGDTAGVPSSPTAGSFKANEAYAELRVPLVSKMPGANLLDLSSAVRISDYSTFGAQSTFKVGARWRPDKDLLIRGNYAQGIRAPGIGELFGSKARFDQSINDPCSDMLGMNGPAAPQDVIDNCVQLGVPADGSYEQYNQQISVTTGGNRELEPETSDSFTASLVYSPSWLEESQDWLDSLDIELTYYRIQLDGAIAAINAQAQLDQCVQTLDQVLCEGISRTPTGVINGFENQLRNIGGITTDGVDVSLTYRPPRTSIGGFRVTSLSSYLLNFAERIPSSNGFTTIHREGTEVGDPERAFPKFKSSLILDWFQREWRASWTLRYIHSVTESCTDLSDYPGTCSKPDPMNDSNSKNVLDPTVYNDVQVIWTPRALDSRVDVTLGVNNLFNQQPPKCYSCALNGFDATTYDVPGVFGYIKAGYRMW